MSGEAALRASGVHAGIGAVSILRDVSLAVSPGQLVTVIGANGAGKTTLLRVLSNVLPPSAGTVEYQGRPTTSVPPHRLARAGLVHVPQGRQIVPTLSVEENLLVGAERSERIEGREIGAMLDQEYRRFPVLRERRHLSAGSLSGGEQQMLAVSRALMMRPQVLLLDEPSLGLAPQIVRTIVKALRGLADDGLAVILVEQMAMVALATADFAYVLKGGEIVLSGRAGDLRKDKALVESYLG